MAPPPNLLLHSLVEFRELLNACLADAAARSVVEIGSESGANTKQLLNVIEGDLWCVEPLPAGDLRQLAADHPRFHLIQGHSPAALNLLPPCDAYVIDGDHNHWTVARELEHVAAAAAGYHPLTILHDVGWPCARRDQYYDPAALPPDAVHPHTWEGGGVPGEPVARADGFRGDGAFAVAITEGGPRNGVLTAVEEHVEATAGLRLATVPAIFGLGVLWDDRAPYAAALAARLDPLDGNPLLDRLERNRLELFSAVLRLQHERAEQSLQQGRLITEYAAALARAEADAAALREQLAALRAAEQAAASG